MALVKAFRDLRVYQKAFSVSLEVHRASLKWPDAKQFGGIAHQAQRASKSVCANVAEGFGKRSSKTEFGRFLSMAMGSVTEMEVWIDYVEALAYEPADIIASWRSAYGEIMPMLAGLRAKVR